MPAPRLRHLTAPLALLTLAAGCGDAPVDPTARTVTFHASGTALIAVREEGGDWRALTPDASGDATADIDGPYTVATVCDVPGFFDYYAVSATPEDADALDVYCLVSDAAAITVSVDQAQLGRVFIGFNTISAGDSATMPPGTYDIVAVDDSAVPPRVAIHRGVSLDASTVVSIDLATEGVAMRAATVTTTGAGGDSVLGSSRLTTAGRTYARQAVDDTQAWLFPPSLLVEGDRQVVGMSAYGDSPAGRSAAVAITGAESAVTVVLPVGITAATRTLGAAPSVSWVGTEVWPEPYFYLANADFSIMWDRLAFTGYTEAMGNDASLAVPDPAQLPGWQPAWNLTGAESLDWYLLLTRRVDDGYQSASWDSTFATERRAAVRPYLQSQRADAAGH